MNSATQKTQKMIAMLINLLGILLLEFEFERRKTD
jgi:hypothetical protein